MNNHRLANVEPEREQTLAEPAEQPSKPPWEDSLKEELEDLAGEWENIADKEPMDTDHDRALRYCAQELREVIEQYE